MNPLFLDYNVNQGGSSLTSLPVILLGIANLVVVLFNAWKSSKNAIAIEELKTRLGVDAYKDQQNFDRDKELSREVILRTNELIGKLSEMRLRIITDDPKSIARDDRPRINAIAELMLWFGPAETALLKELQASVSVANMKARIYAGDESEENEENASEGYREAIEDAKKLIEHFKKLHRDGFAP